MTMSVPPPVVLLRHGQSQWNLENRFTGWVDVDLTEAGRDEARQAGLVLKEHGFAFDQAFTSVLTRAIRTCWITLDTLDTLWVPMHHDWRLNERHYGALAGLNKAETAQRHGEEQVHIWRRSFDIRPEAADRHHPSWEGFDPRYKNLPPHDIPTTECLADTVKRVRLFWEERVVPALTAGERTLISAHGNSLRALIKMLEGLTDSEILDLNIPTGQPMVLTFNAGLTLVSRRYLADPSVIEAAMSAAAHQGHSPKAARP